MTTEQHIKEIYKSIGELKGMYAAPVWVSSDKITLFKNWTRSEIETFRRNNPHLCKNKGSTGKASWVYDKNKIDHDKHS